MLVVELYPERIQLMADTPSEPKSRLPTQSDVQDGLEKQVAQLKREIAKINKSLAARAGEAADQVNGWYDAASDRTSKAAQSLRSQAHSVSDVVKDNPGTVSSAMLLGGLIGFALGVVFAQSEASGSRYKSWYDIR
jgi:hypothetical protein